MKTFVVHYDVPGYYPRGSISKHLKMYTYTARVFQLDLRIVDTNGILKGHGAGKGLQIFSDLKGALENREQTSIVVTEPFDWFVQRGEEPEILKDFKHPDDATYVIGSDYGEVDLKQVEGSKIYRVCITEQSIPSLWSYVVLGILAHDEVSKRWQ